MSDRVESLAGKLGMGECFYYEPPIGSHGGDNYLFEQGIITAVRGALRDRLEPHYWSDVTTLVNERHLAIEDNLADRTTTTQIVRSAYLMFNGGKTREVSFVEEPVTTLWRQSSIRGALENQDQDDNPARTAEQLCLAAIGKAQFLGALSALGRRETLEFGQLHVMHDSVRIGDKQPYWNNIKEISTKFQYENQKKQALLVTLKTNADEIMIPALSASNWPTVSMLADRFNKR